MVSVAPSGLLLCDPGVLRGFHQWWRIISRRLLFKRVDLAYRIFGSLKQPVSPQLKKPVKSKFMADINSRTFWTLSATSLLVSVTSPIYRTHSIIGFDLVKNRTRCWGLLSWQTPCSIFVYSSPLVGQCQPCPSILLTMLSLICPCCLVPSDHAIASPPYLLSRARSLNHDQHSWSRSIWMFTSYSITSGLNERSKTR